MDAILKMENIEKSFVAGGRRVRAVRGVSFTVGAGEHLGLVGESGCGKSTLARIATRLEEPAAGRIILCGEDITKAKGAALRRAYGNVKMIFQEPRSSFDPALTLGRSIAETLKAAGMSDKALRQAETERLLAQCGLDASYAKARPRDVSGGECQRAAIARAVAASPKLLICDEATSALDVSVQAQIMELLRSLGEETGMSFLFISHDLALVSSFCDRVCVMHAGEIVEEGETLALIQRPQNAYTKQLVVSALPAG
ncbi:MAG: ABC transporter ATP-binding protein [Oscillospiraceae bacterium]|jgi:oligopeptide transport system ATP-binding protein